MPYDIGNPGPGLGQTQKCDVVKPVNGVQINLTLENRVSNVNILYEQR